jgi:Lon protease-like protein
MDRAARGGVGDGAPADNDPMDAAAAGAANAPGTPSADAREAEVGAAAAASTEAAAPRGAALLRERRWEEAVREFDARLQATPAGAPERAPLLLGRAGALRGLAGALRAIPAAASERRAVYAPDPHALAAAALRDADAALRIEGLPVIACHAARGDALQLLERYAEAAEAFRAAELHATGRCPALSARRAAADAALGAPVSAAAAAAAARLVSCAAARAAAEADLECSLCARLFFEPVTTPCGHTFCRGCLARAGDHCARCPICRTLLHVGRAPPVTRVLQTILERAFPAETAARAAEEAAAGGAPAGAGGVAAPLPLFVMAALLPGERMALNIFEPRYRLMLRRVMEGSRRLGMAALAPGGAALAPAAVEGEIVEFEALPDGRFLIEVVGRRRFRITNPSEVDGYRVAVPDFFADAPPAPGSPAAAELDAALAVVGGAADAWVARLRALGHSRAAVAELLRRVGERPCAGAPEALSFWVAALALGDGGGQATKAAVLAETSTLGRLRALQPALEQLQAAGHGDCGVM